MYKEESYFFQLSELKESQACHNNDFVKEVILHVNDIQAGIDTNHRLICDLFFLWS